MKDLRTGLNTGGEGNDKMPLDVRYEHTLLVSRQRSGRWSFVRPRRLRDLVWIIAAADQKSPVRTMIGHLAAVRGGDA